MGNSWLASTYYRNILNIHFFIMTRFKVKSFSASVKLSILLVNVSCIESSLVSILMATSLVVIVRKLRVQLGTCWRTKKKKKKKKKIQWFWEDHEGQKFFDTHLHTGSVLKPIIPHTQRSLRWFTGTSFFSWHSRKWGGVRDSLFCFNFWWLVRTFTKAYNTLTSLGQNKPMKQSLQE